MEWPFGVCFGPLGVILECVLEWNKVRFFCCPSLQKC